MTSIQQELPRHRNVSVIRRQEKSAFRGEVLAKLCSSLFYTSMDTPIVELSAELDRHPEMLVLGVVDRQMQVRGLIIRRRLMDILSKPYGRDVMKYKTVERVMEEVTCFDLMRNIYSISSEIEPLLQTGQVFYFLLTDEKGVFQGIFSTIDMLVYLSAITQKDISMARQLQQSIVKKDFMEKRQGFTILGASAMAKGVGGDFYHIYENSQGRWLLSLADVSGKGVAASLVTTAISGMYHIYDFEMGISFLLENTNNYLFETFEAQKFVTGVFVEFEPASGLCTIYDMGHSLLFVYRKERLFRIRTSDENMPLGIQPEITAKSDRFRLEAGDLLVLLTDGILEQTDSSRQEFGEARLLEQLRFFPEKDPFSIKEGLFKQIYQFRGIQPQHDDMTLVMLAYHP